MADEEFRAQLAARLRQLREAKSWSQAELAGKAGVHTTLVGLIEQGRRSASEPTRTALAAALGVPVAELVYGAAVQS